MLKAVFDSEKIAKSQRRSRLWFAIRHPYRAYRLRKQEKALERQLYSELGKAIAEEIDKEILNMLTKEMI